MNPLKFDDQLQNYLLDGALIIWHKKSLYLYSILIRLPKGKFYVLDKIEFQYLLFHQILKDDEETFHASSHNGIKKQVIKSAYDTHLEDNFMYKTLAERKNGNN